MTLKIRNKNREALKRKKQKLKDVIAEELELGIIFSVV